MLEMVESLNDQGETSNWVRAFVTDRLGSVDAVEAADLLSEIRNGAEGPIELIDWEMAYSDEQVGLYTLTLGVQPEIVGRWLPSNEPIIVHRSVSTWVVEFRSTIVERVRQSPPIIYLLETGFFDEVQPKSCGA